MINNGLLRHYLLGLSALAFLVTAYVPALALNRKLEPIQPGLYASGMDGGCRDPDGKDRLFIDRSELHEYESHCQIRKVSPVAYFYVLETDCSIEGEFGHVTYEIAPVARGTLLVQARKGSFMPRDTPPTTYHLCPKVGTSSGAR
ncbi:hypothetical protein GCM10007301_38060 [Azorhizobium oxalatiphilum]|uniref:Uncharacterized protein n=1 Tax=Azorhizobium oxalatiphilum TaxID=980631 RepID=A0A917FFN4_9HYPH|nr:hypothetical protein [Azorhizobium oxalatiphilum]GGF74586.1 hypothetical protein GCM10007301_38060 [Azorhizobium oxalatiphilum]